MANFAQKIKGDQNNAYQSSKQSEANITVNNNYNTSGERSYNKTQKVSGVGATATMTGDIRADTVNIAGNTGNTVLVLAAIVIALLFYQMIQKL